MSTLSLHPPTFLLGFISVRIPYGMEYLFGQFESTVLAMYPPKILPICVGNVGETALMMCQHCLAANKKLACCQYLCS